MWVRIVLNTDVKVFLLFCFFTYRMNFVLTAMRKTDADFIKYTNSINLALTTGAIRMCMWYVQFGFFSLVLDTNQDDLTLCRNVTINKMKSHVSQFWCTAMKIHIKLM